MPYYNSFEGLVQESLDLVGRHRLFIHNGCRILVNYSLGGKAVANKTEVLSHPKALAQCSDYLQKTYPDARWRQVSSTAEAARLVARGAVGLAVANTEALRAHGLEILAENIGNRRPGVLNYTDFFLVSTVRPRYLCNVESSRTFLAVTPDREEIGLLAQVLGQFAFYGINVAKIHSRPAFVPIDSGVEAQTFSFELMCGPDCEELSSSIGALKHRFGDLAVHVLGAMPALELASAD